MAFLNKKLAVKRKSLALAPRSHSAEAGNKQETSTLYNSSSKIFNKFEISRNSIQAWELTNTIKLLKVKLKLWPFGIRSMAASNNTKREGGNRKEEQQNSQSSGSQLIEAKETFATLFELSKLLNTGLDQNSLAICVRLCEQGAHPEALATIVRELRRESQAIRHLNQA